MEPKKLYRNTRNKMISGVCAGISDYINLDVSVIRLLFVLFGCTGTGILAYIVAACIIPEEPRC